MSAPTPAPGDDRPREGYYPDPSIPGYVRYWNGASWVPGTSRPAPKNGEPPGPPPGVRPAVPSVEETGPHFFDEDPELPSSSSGFHQDQWTPAADSGQAGQWGQPGGIGQAGPWGHSGSAGQSERADVFGQPGAAGPAGQEAPRDQPGVSAQPGQAGQSGPAGPGGVEGDGAGRGGVWGADARGTSDRPAQPDGQAARTCGSAAMHPAEDGAPDSGTFMFRRPIPGPAAARGDDGAMTFRPVSSGQGDGSGSPLPVQGPVAAPTPAAPSAPPPTAPSAPSFPSAPSAPTPTAPSAPSFPATPSAGPGFSAGKTAAARAAGTGAPQSPQSAQAAVSPAVSRQVGPQQGRPAQAGPPATPLTTGPGGGQASWAQQVHRLAGGVDEQPVAPWKPPVEDPFQAAARRRAAAHPAGLGKRFAARLIDSLVVGAVTAAAAVPLGTEAVDHVRQKVDAAKLSGREVTVWLLDGTTGTSLGVVLAVLLLAGVGYEVLPTVKWGRTLGKKLCGLQVRDIEAHEPPTFGPALRRWLVYSVPGLLVIGIVGVLWCLFDRPWHQCWHDKAAHTFVAG